MIIIRCCSALPAEEKTSPNTRVRIVKTDSTVQNGRSSLYPFLSIHRHANFNRCAGLHYTIANSQCAVALWQRAARRERQRLHCYFMCDVSHLLRTAATQALTRSPSFRQAAAKNRASGLGSRQVMVSILTAAAMCVYVCGQRWSTKLT
jgi:hypothetical protein